MSKLTEFTNEECSQVNVDCIKKFIANFSKDKQIKVVTILGKSRNGKSSFLNALLYSLSGKEEIVFKSLSYKDSHGKDVTIGINGYLYDDILFLDVQGIGGVQSNADPTVLLYCYYVSDLMIFRSPTTLDTMTLHMLSPIVAKLHKMQEASQAHKPTLLFHVFDAVDGYDDATASENFDILMENRNDQVKGVRGAIKELFNLQPEQQHGPKHLFRIIWTEKPDRNEVKLLDGGKFKDFFKSDNNFKPSIEKLLLILGVQKNKTKNNILPIQFRKSSTFEHLLKSANEINGQIGELKASELDIAANLNEKEIRNWIEGDKYTPNGVQSHIYDELKTALTITNCKEECYQLIQTRIKKIDELIKIFTSKFSKSPEYLRNAGIKEIRKITDIHVKLAQKQLETFLQAEIVCIEQELSQQISAYTFDTDTFNKQNILNYYETLIDSTIDKRVYELKYSELKHLYEDYLTKCLSDIDKKYVQVYNVLTNTQIISYQKNVETIINNREKMYDTFKIGLGTSIDFLEESFAQIVERIVTSIKNKFQIYELKEESKFSKLFKYLKTVYSKKDYQDEVKLKVSTCRILKCYDKQLCYEIKKPANTTGEHQEYGYKNIIDKDHSLIIMKYTANLEKYLLSLEDHFTKERTFALPRLLKKINTEMKINDRRVYFEKIKHNNLYMMFNPHNWPYLSDYHETHMFYIMQEVEFKKYYGDKIFKLYQQYHVSKNANVKTRIGQIMPDVILTEHPEYFN